MPTKDTAMHDGKAKAAEFCLLHKLPQHKAVPHEPRICLQTSTDITSMFK